jgi:hypothetical protein
VFYATALGDKKKEVTGSLAAAMLRVLLICALALALAPAKNSATQNTAPEVAVHLQTHLKDKGQRSPHSNQVRHYNASVLCRRVATTQTPGIGIGPLSPAGTADQTIQNYPANAAGDYSACIVLERGECGRSLRSKAGVCASCQRVTQRYMCCSP